MNFQANCYRCQNKATHYVNVSDCAASSVPSNMQPVCEDHKPPWLKIMDWTNADGVRVPGAYWYAPPYMGVVPEIQYVIFKRPEKIWMNADGRHLSAMGGWWKHIPMPEPPKELVSANV